MIIINREVKKNTVNEGWSGRKIVLPYFPSAGQSTNSLVGKLFLNSQLDIVPSAREVFPTMARTSFPKLSQVGGKEAKKKKVYIKK